MSGEFDPLPHEHDPGAGPYAAPQAAAWQAPVAMSHSGLGIASFVIGLLAGFGTLAVFAYAGYVEASTPGGMSETSPTAVLIGVAMLACAGMLLLGILLGVGGLFQSGRKKVFAIIGTIVNALPLAMAIFLVVLGLSLES